MKFLLVSLLVLTSCKPGPESQDSDLQHGVRSFRFTILGDGMPVQAPDGTLRSGGVCVYGAYDPGLPVVLLSGVASQICTTKTEGAVLPVVGDGPCTKISDTQRCQGSWHAAVVGSLPKAYNLLPGKVIADQSSVQQLEQSVEKSGVLEASVRRWRAQHGIPSGKIHLKEALRFSSVGISSLQLQLADTEVDEGPRVFVADGKRPTVIGPCSLPEVVFTLDGAAFIHARPAACMPSGIVVDEFYAIEGGQLRLVFRTDAGVN